MAQVEEDEYVYHVTYYGRLGNIAARGLVPGRSRSIGGPAYDSHAAKGIFLTDLGGVFFWHSKAEEHAEHASDNVLEDELIPVVLRVSLDNLPCDLDEDELGTRDALHDAWICTKAIDPGALEVYAGSDEGWMELDDWTTIDPEAAVTCETEEPDEDEDEEEDDEDEEEEEPSEEETYCLFKEYYDNDLFPPEAKP